PGARIWDPATGKEIASWLGEQGLLYAMAAAPDGKTVLALSPRGVVRADVGEGKAVEHAFTGPASGTLLPGAAVSPDGKTLAGVGPNRIVCLWDADTGKEKARLGAALGFNPVFAFSPDGRLLAEGALNLPVRLW